MMLRRSLLAAAGLAPFAGPASAQAFPDRPLRLVVPFAPGGSQDVMGRLFANRLGALLGQRVVVENRGGAGGLLGGQEVAQGGRRSDGRNAGEQGLICRRKGRLRPPQVPVTLTSAPRR
jgi:tripartite-type tricarboxylate transporter receptor subunit TctC